MEDRSKIIEKIVCNIFFSLFIFLLLMIIMTNDDERDKGSERKRYIDKERDKQINK